MESLLLSFNTVFPLFFMIVLGYVLVRVSKLDDSSVKKLNNFSFIIFQPALVFYNIYNSDWSQTWNPSLVLTSVIMVVGTFLLLCVIVPLLEKNNRRRGVLIQAIYRSNFLLFGVPICTSLFGDTAGGTPSMIAMFVIPIFNVLAVISLEMFRRGKPQPLPILKGIITNPLIIGSLAAVALKIIGIELPTSLAKVSKQLADMATPLALIGLGGTLKFSSVAHHKRQLISGIAARLVIVPVIAIPIVVMLGFRGVELATLMCLASAPTAVGSYVMAEQMDGDADLASHLVVFSAALSVFTFFIYIFILKSMGFL